MRVGPAANFIAQVHRVLSAQDDWREAVAEAGEHDAVEPRRVAMPGGELPADVVKGRLGFAGCHYVVGHAYISQDPWQDRGNECLTTLTALPGSFCRSVTLVRL